MLVGFLRFLTTKSISSEPSFFHIFIAYSVLLLIPTFFRGGFGGAIYGVKDYVIPAALLLSFPYFVQRNSIRLVFYFVSFLGLVVSLIYFSEFISKNILFAGTFNYTEGIRELGELTGSDGIAESSFTSGLDAFFRLVGPLSHNNSSATFIAIGLLATLPLLSYKKNALFVCTVIFCSIVILVTGSRTAFIAFTCSVLFFYRDRRSIWFAAGGTVILLFFTIVYFVPAFIETISFTSFFNTAIDILGEFKEVDIGRLYNIFMGSGYNYPGMNDGYSKDFFPFMSDDLFILQLASIYGLLPWAFFLIAIMSMNTIPKTNPYYSYMNASNAILICFLITTLHTNALVRPQLYPVFFLFIVMKHLIYKYHHYEK